MSGYHAVVRSAGGGLEITELASSNGTLVNGAPVRRARLKDGDLITIADRRMVLDGANASAGCTSRRASGWTCAA